MPDESPAPPKSSTAKPKATPKPRAVTRKSKAEREEYARQEAERAKERAAQEAAQTPKPPVTRGKAGARGGRGGATASKNDRVTASGHAGVFGAGSGPRPERSRGPVDFGHSEALDGDGQANLSSAATLPGPVIDAEGLGSGKKNAAGGRGKASKAAQEDHIQFEDDDLDDQPSRDIERIGMSSDEDSDEDKEEDEEEDDDDAIVSRKGKQRRTSRPPKPFTGLRPVRATGTDAEEQGDKKAKTRPKIVKSVEETAAIDADSDEMQVVEPLPSGASTIKRDAPSSPELTKKTLKKVDSNSKTKDPKLLAETVEEKAERLRLQDDIESLRDAFLHKSDSDETVDSKEEEAVFGRTDHERMFLFQLPPLVPQLCDPDSRPPHGTETNGIEQVDGVQIKAEDAGAAPATNVESSKSNDPTKTQPEAAPTMFTAESPASQRLPSGLVGKLKIHKSGKVTLDWGGTDMEVRYGSEVDFLQDVICVEGPKAADDIDASTTEREGRVYAMGQVRRKMVLVPDWSKLYT